MIKFSFRMTGVLSAVIACAMLAACSGGSTSSSGSPGSAGSAPQSITLATTLQLSSVNGLLENLVPLNDTIYNPLVIINGDGSISPGLATSWTSNASATVWTFTLRSNVKFSDGSTLTPQDVVWTYEQSKDNPASMNHSYVALMQSVVAEGSNKVVFTLAQPYAAWPREASLLVIVPEKAYTTMGATAFGQHPVGTGPYEVVGFDPGQSVKLRANPHYWGGAPPIKNVTEEQINDETTSLTGLQSGSISVAVLSPATAPQAKATGSLTVQTVQSDVVSYLGFDTMSPATDQLALRQAISYAIDRQAMATTLFHGEAKPIGQVLAPSVFGYNASVPVPAYNVAKAKALVKQSGYSGQSITFTYPVGPSVPQGQVLAEAVQGYLKAVGINTTLKQIPQATFVTDWFAKSLPGIYLFTIQPSTLDADLVFGLLGSTAGEFTNPAVAANMLRQASEINQAQRQATLLDITNIFNQQVFYAPLLNAETSYVSEKGLSVIPRPDGYLLPQFMK